MATNYTFAQVVNAFAKADDVNLMVELGRRYPVLVAKACKLIALAGDEFVSFANAMPEHMTANKLNRAMLESTAGTADAEDEATENEADNEVEDSDSADLATKTTKELYAMCIKKGLKVSKYGKPKSYYIDALSGSNGPDESAEDDEQEEAKSAKKPTKKATKKAEEVDEDVEDNEAENLYEGKPATELFKECKKRGIKAVPKKPAKYYVDLLTKADAETEESDGDDWEDEEEQEKPAAKKSSAKKPTKKAETEDEDDDDDDWDI